jgi:hypothetical protein
VANNLTTKVWDVSLQMEDAEFLALGTDCGNHVNVLTVAVDSAPTVIGEPIRVVVGRESPSYFPGQKPRSGMSCHGKSRTSARCRSRWNGDRGRVQSVYLVRGAWHYRLWRVVWYAKPLTRQRWPAKVSWNAGVDSPDQEGSRAPAFRTDREFVSV